MWLPGPSQMPSSPRSQPYSSSASIFPRAAQLSEHVCRPLSLHPARVPTSHARGHRPGPGPAPAAIRGLQGEPRSRLADRHLGSLRLSKHGVMPPTGPTRETRQRIPVMLDVVSAPFGAFAHLPLPRAMPPAPCSALQLRGLSVRCSFYPRALRNTHTHRAQQQQ